MSPFMTRRIFPSYWFVFAAAALTLSSGRAADRPQWGSAWGRNLASAEKGLPHTFDPKTGLNVRWTVPLGTETHSSAVVAHGRVYIGTNNGQPRDPRHDGDRGVLMSFDENTGALAWQLVVPKRVEDQYMDWPKAGMSSPATVEDNRVYMMSNRGEVMCLDASGLDNGNDGPYRDEAAHLGLNAAPVEPGPLDADILWSTDLMKEAGIWPHDAAHSSIMVRGPHLYVNSGTGVDNTHRKIRTQDAPGLVVIDKATGTILARDDEHIAPNIFHCTWSSPAEATFDGRPVIVFCGGNGIVYGFEPIPADSKPGAAVKTLKCVFRYDPDPDAPKAEVHRFTTNRQEGPSNIFAMPVFVDGRLYIASGGDVFWGKNEARLDCLELGSKHPGGSHRLWRYDLGKHVMSTPTFADGLVYIADTAKTVHCIDAATGTAVWTHEMRGEFWASALVADGKVYIGSRQGDFAILAAGREKKVLCSTALDGPISSTATAANGTIFVATMKTLYALGNASRPEERKP